MKSVELLGDIRHKDAQLVFGVKHLDALGVGVVSDSEGSGNGGGVFAKTNYLNNQIGPTKSKHNQLIFFNLHHLVFGILKRFRHKVNRLVIGNGILLQSRLCRLEFTQFGFAGQRIFQLTNRRQKTSSEGPQLAFLSAQTKLDGEPEAL